MVDLPGDPKQLKIPSIQITGFDPPIGEVETLTGFQNL
jgi:hypothetical protein